MELERTIIDTIVDRPICFEAGGKTFEVRPLSLGTFLLVSQIIERVGISIENINASVFEKTQTHREDLLRLVSICTLEKRSCLYEPYVRENIKAIEEISNKDLAVLVVSILSLDRSSYIRKEAGIDEENQEYAKSSNRQNTHRGRSFGGKTLYGSLIDVACQRYGWRFSDVVWGISFANLQLLLADQLRTLFTTEESKNSDTQVIDADDPQNKDLVKAIIGGYKF